MIVALYFSPAGSTRRIAEMAARRLAERSNTAYRLQPYTLPAEREAWQGLSADDFLVWCTPVYAGRVPNKTLGFVLTHIAARGGRGVCIAVFGNRHYDNCLAEMSAIMLRGGIIPVAAAAVAARHVFSPRAIAPGRPDSRDCQELLQWCDAIDLGGHQPVAVPGNAEQPYYTPLGASGQPARFLKALPTTDPQRCNGCGTCASLCPMGIITLRDGLASAAGTCIKCQACLLGCPQQAMAFADPDFLSHVRMLEAKASSPAPNAFFL